MHQDPLSDLFGRALSARARPRPRRRHSPAWRLARVTIGLGSALILLGLAVQLGGPWSGAYLLGLLAAYVGGAV